MMKQKHTLFFFIAICLIMSSVIIANAQTPRPPKSTNLGEEFPPFLLRKGLPFEESSAETYTTQLEPAAIPMGKPGTVFRYVQTFGETKVPFFEDPYHFYLVEGIATTGNSVYIGDAYAHRVLKFNNNGQFENEQYGKGGVIDYSGTPLDQITDVGVDPSGKVWIVDAGARHVVKFNPITKKIEGELGETWRSGSDNNHFADPIGIAFDSSGNIYVSDSGYWGEGDGNNRIQIFNPDGSYRATIGGGSCGLGNTKFCGTRRITISGNLLYVADSLNHRVQIYNISNPDSPVYIGTLGTAGVAGNSNAHFDTPQGVAADNSFIYVADTGNNRVQVFYKSTYNYFMTLGGSYGTGNYQFKSPTDVAVDASGYLYVADISNKRVQQFKWEGSTLIYQRTYGTTGVSYVTDLSHFYYPNGVAVGTDGSIYIVEERGHRLVKLNASGVPQWGFGEAGQPERKSTAHLTSPLDVAVGPQGHVFVVEPWGGQYWGSGGNHSISVFNPNNGALLTRFGGYGSANNQFIGPTGIGIDNSGKVYIADSGNSRVQIYLYNNNQFSYQATISGFYDPIDVAIDPNGYIYVSDADKHSVEVFNSNRVKVRTIGGDSTGRSFDYFSNWGPHYLAVDKQGRLYVTDSGNCRVQVFDNFANNNAYLTTIDGSCGDRDGRFNNVMGIAVGPDGSVYTTEIHNNHRIQKFSPGVPRWTQVNINGFGDPRWRVSSLAEYGEYLYAGAFRTVEYGGRIYRMDKNGNWQPVVINGFATDKKYNIGIDYLYTFKGHLYAATWSSKPTPPYTEGGEIWRSADGISNWELVIAPGFGDVANEEIFSLTDFNGYLYASTWSNITSHGVEIWRSQTGNPGTWARVVNNGLGDQTNGAVLAFKESSGALFASTYSYDWVNELITGAEIWRSENGENWNKVTDDCFDQSTTCYEISTLESFNGYLYAGTALYDGTTQMNSSQIWRCQESSGCDQENEWQKLTLPAQMQKPQNYAIRGLKVFDNQLYAVANNFQTGLEVWRSPDGLQWEQIGFAGLGDVNNYGNYWNNAITLFNDRFLLGTLNSGNGGEVWMFLHKNVFLPLLAR